MKRILSAGAAALALAVVTFAYLSWGTTTAPHSSVVLLDGSSQTTADFKGQVTLVNFAEMHRLIEKLLAA